MRNDERRSDRRRVAACCAAALLSWLAPSAPAAAQPDYDFDVVWKAAVDECFDGIGNPYPPVVAGACPTGQPKRNAGYVFALTTTADSVWYATVANTAFSSAMTAGVTVRRFAARAACGTATASRVKRRARIRSSPCRSMAACSFFFSG